MFQSLVRCPLMLFASILVAYAPQPSTPQQPLKQALIGKMAYNQGTTQQSCAALMQLAHQTELDETTYLQLFDVALSQGQEQQLLQISLAPHNGPSGSLYQKGAVVLQLYLSQNIAPQQWDLLSKQDWVAFFARLPAEKRLMFLENMYRPEMVPSASARAFMIEMLMVIGLSQEALDLALFPIEKPNDDLIVTYYQTFPAGVAPLILAPLGANSQTDVQYRWAQCVMRLQADRPLRAEVARVLQDGAWSPEQRFSLARCAIASGQSTILWQQWHITDFDEQQQLLLQMEQCCYEEQWEQLGILLAQYSCQDDSFLYYKGCWYGACGDVQRAVWSFDRINDPELQIQAASFKIHLIAGHNPTQAMIWAKELIQAQTWGPRELGVLQANLMYELGYLSEAVSFLEQLVEQEMGYTPAINLLVEYYLETPEGVLKAQQVVERYEIIQGKAARLLKQTH